MRVGVLGGTFDPPHHGHLILGEYAADSLALDKVLFIPAAEPPHKQTEYKTPVEHRLAMLALAAADNPRFELSRIDVDRAGPHYSFDTVQIVQQQNPAAEIYFIMGADSLRDLPLWYRPADFIRLCWLAVLRRPDVEASPTMHAALLPELAQRVVMIDAPQIEISSSDIRQRLQTGHSIRYLLPDNVRSYIQKHELYQKA